MSPPGANPSPRPRWEASGKVACGETAGINPALGCTWHFSKGEGPLPCGRGPSERREGWLGGVSRTQILTRPALSGNHELTSCCRHGRGPHLDTVRSCPYSRSTSPPACVPC